MLLPLKNAGPSHFTPHFQHFIKYSQQITNTHSYSWVERSIVWLDCLDQQHHKMTQPGLRPGPFNLETSMLTVRPPHFYTEGDEGEMKGKDRTTSTAIFSHF